MPEKPQENASHIDLRKKRRFGESIIQALLFLAGAFSILTTVGIVYELGKESLTFFTRELWEQSNKELDVAIYEFDDEFTVSESGRALAVDEIIRIDAEDMLITAVDGLTLTVERGYRDTVVASHDGETEIFTSRRVSLWEFFTGTDWNPQIGKFGLWALLNATLMTTGIAMLVALPIGLSIAIFLSEYASHKARQI